MSADSQAAASHDEMWELIPWLVNGRLTAAVAAAVTAHLKECAQCAEEFREQRCISQAMQADDSIAFASEASFQKLAARLDAAPVARRMSAMMRSAAAAGVVAALGLAAWGGWSLQRTADSSRAPYRTLTSPAPVAGAGAQLRVVFAPDLTLVELAQLLHSIDANITSGPTEAGVYTLGFGASLDSQAQVARRLAFLRADEHVRFAEPVMNPP
ncbi:MAG TPA: zf-HC2 domain-containing protein [Steroidobacteraceae bacterium]